MITGQLTIRQLVAAGINLLSAAIAIAAGLLLLGLALLAQDSAHEQASAIHFFATTFVVSGVIALLTTPTFRRTRQPVAVLTQTEIHVITPKYTSVFHMSDSGPVVFIIDIAEFRIVGTIPLDDTYETTAAQQAVAVRVLATWLEVRAKWSFLNSISHYCEG